MARNGQAAGRAAQRRRPRAGGGCGALPIVGDGRASPVPQRAAAAADRADGQGQRRRDFRRAGARRRGRVGVAIAARGGSRRDRFRHQPLRQGAARRRLVAAAGAVREHDRAHRADGVDARRADGARRLCLSADQPDPGVRRQDRVRRCHRAGPWAAVAMADAGAVAIESAGGDRGRRYCRRDPQEHQHRGDDGDYPGAGARRQTDAAERQAQRDGVAADRPQDRAVRHCDFWRIEALSDPRGRDRRHRDDAERRARTRRQGIARGREGAGVGAAAR